MKIKIFILVLLMSIASCEKEAIVKKHLSEPPVLKGFILRDHVGALIKQVGTPNVKYSDDSNSSLSQRILVYPTFFNTGIPVHSTSILFSSEVSQDITITIVEGTVNMNLSAELNMANQVLKNDDIFMEIKRISINQINNNYFSVSLSSIKKPGTYRIYIDFGDYVLYDNILIQ